MDEREWQFLEGKTPGATASAARVPVKVGDRVRLRPNARGDVFDIALAGKTATVEAIEQDYEGKHHVSVVLDDDPGRDIGMMRQPGHRFFFSTAEIEPLGPAADTAIQANNSNVLVAGIGNIFLGDDGFGVEVVRRFAAREQRKGVRVADFGIRSFDLVYALIEKPDVTILVDACPRGGTPGDLYVVEPETESQGATASPAFLDAHTMNPVAVIRAAQMMGGPLRKILLLGCEPLTSGPAEGHIGLSEPVAAAVDRAVPLLECLVERIVNERAAPEAKGASSAAD